MIKSLLVTIVLLVSASFVTDSTVKEDHTFTYDFYVPCGVSWKRHVLHVSIVPSLYEYYRGRSHDGDNPSQFVTPDAVLHVADDLWRNCKDNVFGEEAFANSVLMLVHQIPYEVSAVQYAVETLVNNKGDCDTLSYLAASILKAGGLDIVLFEYAAQKHTNIGVHLSHPPIYSTSTNATYYQYKGKRYYVAECTSRGVDVREDWRVGECPKELAGARAQIISLGPCEDPSPATVSSHLDAPLASSSITITTSSDTIQVGDTVEISGTTSPLCSDRQVVIYLSSTRFYWSVLKTLQTDSSGRYSYSWRPSLRGPCYLRASVSGGEEHAGADSDTYTLNVSTQSNTIYNVVTIGFTLMAAVSILFGLSATEIVKTIIEFL